MGAPVWHDTIRTVWRVAAAAVSHDRVIFSARVLGQGHHAALPVAYSGTHCVIVTRWRSSSSANFGATPSFCAYIPTANAIWPATVRMAFRRGRRDAPESFSAGELRPNSR